MGTFRFSFRVAMLLAPLALQALPCRAQKISPPVTAACSTRQPCTLSAARKAADIKVLRQKLLPGETDGQDGEAAREEIYGCLRAEHDCGRDFDLEAAAALCDYWATSLSSPVDREGMEGICAYSPAALGRLEEMLFRDQKQAARLYSQAAEAGNKWAKTRLGVFLLNGIGAQPDYVQAAKLFGDSGDLYPPALTQMGLMYERGMGLKQNSEKANFWYSKAAAKGDPGAAGRLALLYYKGDGVQKNTERARDLFKRASSSKTAAYGAAMLLCKGPDNCPDGALDPLRAAAAEGFETDFWPVNGKYVQVKMKTPGLPEAQYALGQYHLLVSSDTEAAIASHEEAAAQGYGPSHAKLAGLYYHNATQERLAKACSSLSVTAQDKTSGPPPDVPGLANYCNFLLFAGPTADRQPAQAISELRAAADACASGACSTSFRELAVTRLDALEDFEAQRSSAAADAGQQAQPPAQPEPKKKRLPLLPITALSAVASILLLRGAFAKGRDPASCDALRDALKKSLQEMKRDGIEPPRRPESSCGPDEARLWRELETLQPSCAAQGGKAQDFTVQELRLMFHAALDRNAFAAWAAAQPGRRALELALALSRDEAPLAAALITPRVFADCADDHYSCDQALRLLGGKAGDFAQARLGPQADSAFCAAFGAALLRAGDGKNAMRAYAFVPRHLLSREQAWDAFRLYAASSDFLRAVPLLEKLDITADKAAALREIAASAMAGGHPPLARAIQRGLQDAGLERQP
ncbi:MAG: sel1 repeat family protein [Elusimicrobia bacterium]|nr:sel1 repeat family protein [Elusimicrobiota bacterium]